jgi:hypothetical protein
MVDDIWFGDFAFLRHLRRVALSSNAFRRFGDGGDFSLVPWFNLHVLMYLGT